MRTLIAATFAVFTMGAAASIAAEKQSSAPESVMPVLQRAYAEKSVETMAELLTADYSFHTSEARLAEYMVGFSRDSELRSMRGLLHGVKKENGFVMAPAESVHFRFGDVRRVDDPEHPDSTAHYQVLCVTGLTMHLKLSTGRVIDTPPGLHVIHAVRGDAAQLAEGQSPDPERWYIRRWLENLGAVTDALASLEGKCGEEFDKSEVPSPAASPLGIRALRNPACARLEVMLDLPGTEPVEVKVLDVTGRVRNTREIAVARAGALKVDAGEGAGLTPGVYWVRATQGSRRPTTRMVVVAR